MMQFVYLVKVTSMIHLSAGLLSYIQLFSP